MYKVYKMYKNLRKMYTLYTACTPAMYIMYAPFLSNNPIFYPPIRALPDELERPRSQTLYPLSHAYANLYT